MADLQYGGSQGDWRDAIRRAQDQARATDEMSQKEEQRRTVEESAAVTEERSSRVRTGMAGATADLTTRLVTNTEALRAETAAVEASVAVMERALSLRRQIGQTPIVSGTSVRTARGLAAGGAGGVVAGVEEDPNAAARLSAAQRGLAAAEIARANAQRDVAAARRSTAATPEQLTPLVGQRELANQQLQVARTELRSAQANVEQQQLLAQARTQEMAEQRAINDAMQRERVATEERAAQAQQLSVMLAQEVGIRQRGGQLAIAGVEPAAYQPPQVPALAPASGFVRPGFEQGTIFGGYGGPVRREPFLGTATGGGPAESTALPQDPEAAGRLQALRREATANAEAISTMGAAQSRANQAFQEASFIYADNSSRLSRHGALTTEFIQALARGQVTLGEFGSQLTSTIGKFGGWAIAGAAVYGVYDIFKHLTEGATETQAAIQQLGRFIPGLGGPAGGGTSQVGPAAATVRDISTQFNLPIKEVTDAMQVMARVFPNLRDAGDATRAVLAASRLDQVPPNVSTQYFTGIAQSLGFAGQPGGGAQLIGIINSLNSLQSLLGARVSQTLPALARAAPAAEAGGLVTFGPGGKPDLSALEAVVALGVRAGIPGNQVGTALLRSIGTFAYRPQSQLAFREYGIEPQSGRYRDLIEQVLGTIDRRARGRGGSGPGGTGPLSGPDLRNLAVALGGPLLGARTLLPILAAEQLRPGAYESAVGLSRRPRPYQEDLGAVLGTVGERFRAIGIALQNFGSQLEQAGLLTPITALLDAFVLLTHVIERVVSPFTEVLSVFNRLPGVVRDAIGVFAAFRLGSYLLNTRFGGGAQEFAGRLPGLSALRDQPREAVEGIRGNLQNYLVPEAQQQAENASRRLMDAQGRVTAGYNELATFVSQNRGAALGPLSSPARQTYEEGVSTRRQAITAAEGAIPGAEAEVARSLQLSAQRQAQVALAKDSQYTWAERAAILEQEGFAAQSETVDLQQQLSAAYGERIAALRAGGGGALAGTAAERAAPAAGAAVGESAIIAGATVAVGALSRNQAVLSDLQSGLTTSGLVLPPGYRPESTGPTPVAEKTLAERYLAGERAYGLAGAFRQNYGATEGARYGAPELIASNPTRLERATGALENAANRVSRLGEGVGGAINDAGGVGPYLRNAVKGVAGSSASPFAALLGTQLLGGAIGGGVGSYVSNVLGQAATGTLIAQMLGRGGPAGLLVGGTLGAVAGNFSTGSGNGLLSLLGGGGGAGLGALAASLLGGPVGVAAGVGALAGSTIIPAIFGSQPSPQDVQNRANLDAAHLSPSLRRLAGADQAIQYARQAGQDPFEASFGGELATSFLSTGTSGQQAQANVRAQISRFQGELLLYGPQSHQGRQAQRSLNDVISAAIDQAAIDPSTAQQIVQQVTSTKQQPIQQRFQYLLQQQAGTVVGGNAGFAATPFSPLSGQPSGPLQKALAKFGPQLASQLAGPPSAAQQAAQQYQQQVVGPFYEKFLQAGDALHDADNTLNQAIASGSKQRIDAARKSQQQAQTDYQGASGAYTLAQQAATIAEQGFYQQQYQSETQLLGAQGQLGQAQAGGSQRQQLLAQRNAAQAHLRNLQTYKGKLSPQLYASESDTAQAQIIAIQNQIAAQPLTLIASQGAISVASAPVGDPVAAARLQLQSYRDQLAYMQAHAHAFDPSSINDMIAQVVGAERTLAQTGADFAIQMNDINTQIAAAQEYGNAVQQAATNIAGARRDTALAVTPQQRGAARLNVITQQNAAHQAALQRIQAEGQLAEAQQSGDPVAAAQAAQRLAGSLLAHAHGIDEQISAETALAAANYQYQQAITDRYVALGQLAASETVNPVEALRRQTVGLTNALAHATAPQLRVQLGTQLNTTKHQYEQGLIDQRSQVVDFQFQMMQITSGQAVKQLEDLLHLKGITLAQRQQILEQIRRYELGLETPIGGTGFDIAPGNVRLPTYYDVTHGIAHRGDITAVHHDATTVHNLVNVYVRDHKDVGKVADALDRVMGTKVKRRLRSARVTT